MRFSVNVSMLFAEVPFLERFACVREAGFDAVEFWWPHGEEIAAVEREIASAGLKVALFNFDAGDMAAGDRGLLADPARSEQFRANVPVALALAERLGCPRLNALVGLRLPGLSKEEQSAMVRESLRYAADRAAAVGLEIVVEAVNTFENGPYLLASTSEALALIDSVERENLALQYDVYHMVTMGEEPGAVLRQHVRRMGHIQIADAPGRGQPGSGSIDYEGLLPLIEQLGYQGYVGLEYRPIDCDSRASLAWTKQADRATPGPASTGSGLR